VKAALKFPESIDGTLEGISDAGIETFAGNPLAGLAREQAQNSIDARDESKKAPVKVTYQLFSLASGDLPGFAELKDAITRSEAFWDARCNKTRRFLQRAMKTLQQPKIYCLRISDRNTTGLTGSAKRDQGNWFNLTKASGVSEKASGKGGSFGIGKNAFFANSLLRTVFFSTLDIEGCWAFQGVSKLVSHTNAENQTTRGTGFFGETKGYLPLTEQALIPHLFQCQGAGTDIVIVGFDFDEAWRKNLMAAFAENFFVAINDGLLEISIEQEDDPETTHLLTSSNLGDVVKALANEDPRSYRHLNDLYDALVGDEAIRFETEIEGLGKMNLRLLKREGSRKKVAMFRRTGMKIFEKDRFRTPVEFVGVFRCLGEDGNAFLRRLEPPSHDRWEPARYEEDISHAKRTVNRVNDWMRECVATLQSATTADKELIPGLERFLPDDFEDPFDKSALAPVEGDPTVPPEPLEGVSGIVRLPKPSKPVAGSADEDEPGADDEPGTDDDRGSYQGPGGGGGGGGGGDDGPGGRGGPASENKGLKEIEIPYRAFFDAVKLRYRMVAQLPNAGDYEVTLFAIGDDGRPDLVEVTAAELLTEGKQRPLTITGHNRLSRIKVDAASTVEIQFTSPSFIPRTVRAKVFQNG
jgi:hypothetical protein